MMEIVINRKELHRAIEDVLLKGRYRGASKSKIGSIDSNVACLIKNRKIVLANANHTIAALVSVNCETGIESIKDSEWAFFDAEKAIKYLKSMKDDAVTLKVDSSSLNIVGSSSVKMPLSVEHSGIKGIAKLLTSSLKEEQAKFGSTTFDTILTLTDGEDFSRAIKECAVVGTAAYNLTYDGSETLTLTSSNFQETEHYSSTMELAGHKGDPVTIEFSAPLDKFCKGPMYICLKEASPILMIGADRKLIVAPYIRGG